MILTLGMAEHPRTLLREAVIALLVAANTDAGARVDDTRVDPHKKTELPAISVYTLSEPIDPISATTAPRELTRYPKLEITAWVAHSSAVPVGKAMDRIAKQIEDAMHADQFIGGKAGDTCLEDTTMEVVEGDGHSDPLVGIITLTYSATYRTDTGATATDDFITVDATAQVVGGVPTTVPAEDTFTVQEP